MKITKESCNLKIHPNIDCAIRVITVNLHLQSTYGAETQLLQPYVVTLTAPNFAYDSL
jgi:hypothetical protein